jgi:hypothetical protein
MKIKPDPVYNKLNIFQMKSKKDTKISWDYIFLEGRSYTYILNSSEQLQRIKTKVSSLDWVGLCSWKQCCGSGRFLRDPDPDPTFKNVRILTLINFRLTFCRKIFFFWKYALKSIFMDQKVQQRRFLKYLWFLHTLYKKVDTESFMARIRIRSQTSGSAALVGRHAAKQKFGKGLPAVWFMWVLMGHNFLRPYHCLEPAWFDI